MGAQGLCPPSVRSTVSTLCHDAHCADLVVGELRSSLTLPAKSLWSTSSIRVVQVGSTSSIRWTSSSRSWRRSCVHRRRTLVRERGARMVRTSLSASVSRRDRARRCDMLLPIGVTDPRLQEPEYLRVRAEYHAPVQAFCDHPAVQRYMRHVAGMCLVHHNTALK